MPTQPKLEALHAATGPDLRRLLLVDEVLCNPRLHKAYRIENGILVRLIEEAVDVEPGAHQRSMPTRAMSQA